MLFDAHTHWIANAPPGGKGRLKNWLAGWDLHGVTHGIVLPLQGLMDDLRIRKENDDIAAVCARSHGRMIPFCTVNPTQGKAAVEELTRCLHTLNSRGLKFHPWLQGISLSSKEIGDLCEISGEFGAPVLVHDGTPCFSLPSQAALLARRHPKTIFILGHCGIFEHWREAIEAMRYAENLWGCLCAPYLAALREIIARSDIDRLLWGSDYGFGTADMIDYRLQLFNRLDLSDNQRDAIFSCNPSRLFRLNINPAPPEKSPHSGCSSHQTPESEQRSASCPG